MNSSKDKDSSSSKVSLSKGIADLLVKKWNARALGLNAFRLWDFGKRAEETIVYAL